MGHYMVVAITGANGFVGAHVAEYLEQKHQKIRRITRKETGDYKGTMRFDWLDGVHTVVHAAAVAHSGHKLSDAGIEHIQHINTEVPLAIAAAAAQRGVGRFIFLSSAHVYGRSAAGVLDEDADTLPTNIYGASKMDTENRLVALAEKTGLELVILRPPLIYGPRVKANFLMLMKLVKNGLPLPFGALNEPRSYCYIGNLADGIFQLLRTEQPCWNDVYNIADAQPVSIRELCTQLASAMDQRAIVFPLPKWLIRSMLEVSGKRHMIETLCKPLVLDTKLIEYTLGWQPPFATQVGLKATTNWYKERK